MNEETIWTESEECFATDGATITMGRLPKRWRFKVETELLVVTGQAATLTNAKQACEALMGVGR